jgi:hypothetical protein
MSCTGWLLNLAGEAHFNFVLEWELFLILDLHLTPECDMDSASIILPEQHIFSYGIP